MIRLESDPWELAEYPPNTLVVTGPRAAFIVEMEAMRVRSVQLRPNPGWRDQLPALAAQIAAAVNEVRCRIVFEPLLREVLSLGERPDVLDQHRIDQHRIDQLLADESTEKARHPGSTSVILPDVPPVPDAPYLVPVGQGRCHGAPFVVGWVDGLAGSLTHDPAVTARLGAEQVGRALRTVLNPQEAPA